MNCKHNWHPSNFGIKYRTPHHYMYQCQLCWKTIDAILKEENMKQPEALRRADERNQTLDEIAKKIEAMPFGDTAASFAVWIREQKT